MQGKGTVRAVDRKTDFCVFDIELPAERTDNVHIGASVAINGTCLTVVAQQGATLRFDVMVETLRRTNLGALQPGTQINFERSARVGDEIGGHTVSGHVHTTATIVDVQDTENNRRVEYEVGEVVAGGAGAGGAGAGRLACQLFCYAALCLGAVSLARSHLVTACLAPPRHPRTGV